ncbi:retrotransposon protein, putative, ty1-copia subclass [Tanacetum coccineum]
MVPCMSGKMQENLTKHQVERAKDLLGLIHTDVCGPFKITSRQGANYFITFTDDFSHYGYVYLLKHKHEVFETFKVFQKEVENQLGKTIKSLRSDRGGEYMSQEFLDHLKDHGIIAHHTPPYTPQHNGVSERRNRTLLDMVRSMMSQTTLPKSFWDYALETAARILNMDFIALRFYDYEIWHMMSKTGLPQGYLYEEALPPTKLAYSVWIFWIDTNLQIAPCKTSSCQNADEPCVYLKASGSNVTFLILYVDDILIMGNSIPMLQDVKSYLGKCFAMKDLGEAAYILGIKIYRDRSRRIPMQDKLRLSKSQGASTPAELKRMQNVPYASVVGSIMYAVRCTRPDVAFAQNITSRFQQNPGDLHWTTKEAEYIAAFDASKEAVWVRKFISGLGIVPTIEKPINMYCDNTRAIAIANESGITKDDNLADPFTKALAFPKHSEHTRNIGMLPASSLM